MATSVRDPRIAVRVLIGLLIVAMGFWLSCEKGHKRTRVLGRSLQAGCPANAPPSNATQLQACLSGLQFDTITSVGDEQRLLVYEIGGPPHCTFGDTTRRCRHGPLAKIEPVVGAHERDTTELNEGRIIARLFLKSEASDSYPKLGLVSTDTTYWWVKRQTATTALSTYIRPAQENVIPTPVDTISIEQHPPGTFERALARFIWDDLDEKTQGPCGQGCCH